LDNNLTVPALYFADMVWVAPNADITLYGTNLAGTVTAHSGGLALSATPLSATSVRATAPASPGELNIGLTVNGMQAVGTVAVTVVAATNAATVNALPNYILVPGGLLLLTGSGFGPDTEVWLNQQLLQIVARSDDGTELYVRLPGMTGTGRLSVVAGGVRSAGIDVNITGLSYTAAVAPVGVFAPASAGIYAGIFNTPAVLPVYVQAP
jgi:hypothetical protein